ncbi:hypothetical protein VP01_2758g2 [Puccinia sorghi]|uniref:Uncharacterized protein n=1 Tax=Puccinia sorghi TaxID=27349 RepID=A0A0L6V2Z6_9BASI|nr:hypothetical protein VP01_2758g2 [Puccinia sorghi]
MLIENPLKIAGAVSAHLQPLKAQELRFAEISTDSHAEVANYFNQRYYSKHKDDKEKFLKEVFSYLASPALTPNLLSHWLPALEIACEHHKTFGVHRELILYGLHTLILQNYQNRGLTQTIYVAVNRLMESQKIWFARYFPNGLLEWSRELLTPASGLSSKLGTWEQFDQMLRSEPNLNTLRQAIGNQEPSLGSKLEPIERIFSEPPPKNVSAQTRVAAIGLLTHAKRINDRTRTEVFNLITRLLANQTRYFLFPHEKTLLNYVPGRHA